MNFEFNNKVHWAGKAGFDTTGKSTTANQKEFYNINIRMNFGNYTFLNF